MIGTVLPKNNLADYIENYRIEENPDMAIVIQQFNLIFIRVNHFKLKFSGLTIATIMGIFVSLQGFAQKQIVSCVGNSITYGYELSNPSTQSYPGQLQALLGTTEWKVGNFGDSGRSMLKEGGYSYWDSQKYKDALASNPDYLILKLGTNDSKRWLWDWQGSNFKTDYKAMVQSFQNLSSNPEIWIALLIPGEKPDWDFFDTYIKDKVNPKIKETALEMGLGLIDLYNEFDSIGSELYLPDSIHPSVAGAGVIAQKVNEMLLMQKPEILYTDGKLTSPDGDDYQWYFNGKPVASGNGGKQKELIITEAGKYKVSIKLSTDNETRIISQELDIQLTSVKSSYIEKVKIYPNPFFDVIHVQTGNITNNACYTITDAFGKHITSGNLSNNNEEINIGHLTVGIYILSIGNQHLKIFKTN